MIGLFKIGFLPVRIWDILDILIVAYLMYQIYRLLRGNIAFNIFVGVLMMFVVWGIVNQLKMDLLAAVMRQFVSVGVIIIAIIFQQEIRRFLFVLGNSTLRQRSRFLRRILDRNLEPTEERERHLRAIKNAVLRMSRDKTGALIVLVKDVLTEGMSLGGTEIEGMLSEQLLESIFNKQSPLHDGAVLIRKGRIEMAGCVLPVSENPNLPKEVGLRHRAAVGISERFSVFSLVVSEQSGQIATAYEGHLTQHITADELEEALRLHLV